MEEGRRVKNVNDEALKLWHEAKGLMDQWEGKEMPADVQAQVDKLLDAVDAKREEAKRALRATETAGYFTQVDESQRLPVITEGKAGEGAQSGQASEADKLQSKAFNKALTGGTAHLSEAETKALQANINDQGGYLVAPQQFVDELLKDVDNQVVMRRLGRVIRMRQAHSLGVPTLDTRANDADWTGEVTPTNEDNSIKFGKRELKPSPLSKEVTISRKLLRSAALDPASIVREEMAYAFGITEEKAFMTGDGNNKPLGVFTASSDGISTARDTAAASATALAGDDFINAKHDLKPQYWPKAKWVLHRDILKALRKVKDTTGQYLWSPGLAGGMPSTILDVPYELSEYAPSTMTTGLYVAIIGDFSRYWIAESQDFEVQVLVEEYARQNKNGYIGRQEVDGMPVREEGFRRLKMA